MMSSLRPARFFALAALSLALLTACTPVIPLDAAPDAANPDCAEIIVRLPEAIDDQPKRETNAQATGAWGSPAAILLRCGVEVPGPSALPCFTVKGVDWLRDSSEAPNYIFTTFGRDPAVEVIIDSELASSSALTALGNAVGTLVAQRECLAAEDVLGEE